MTATVHLLPHITSGGYGPPRFPMEPIRTCRPFIRSLRARGDIVYWHRPRSGTRHLKPNGEVERTTYQLWCGPFLYGHRAAFREQPPVRAGEAICGTCDGRARGAGQVASDGTLIFTPRWLTPPKQCPGSARDGWYTEITPGNWRVGTCLVCFEIVPIRAIRGSVWYSNGAGPQRHEPGPNLIPGCDFHAWNELRLDCGKVVCRCTVETRRGLLN